MKKVYDNFNVAIYCTASCLDNSFEQLSNELDFFEKHINVSKVYVESHRGDVTLSKERLLELKQFLEGRGIEVAGGITPTLGEAYRPGYNRLFGGICYTEEASRAKMKEVIERTASVFDEIILDDFFFTNCGCDDCLSLKGDRTWEEFRLALLQDVSENLVVNPAKAVNPNVKMVIKYPNWNESYSSSGYNTIEQPPIFDGVYTGTETRDPETTQQHLPRYASYSLLRWMDNLVPGKNGGGWFDSLDCTYIDYYLEQANLTVFGKAKELTLFCYSLLKDSNYTPALGFQLEKLDQVASEISNPVGLKVYEPHQAKGEEHLYDYLGMLGIPIELTPHFPTGDAPILVTANAAKDSQIIERMKGYLRNGGNVIMTSGFIEKMEGNGIEEFTTIRTTGKKMNVQQFAIDTEVCSFEEFTFGSSGISFPLFSYSTNGTWQTVIGTNKQNNIPVLMYDNYSKGKVYSFIIPDNFADLRLLPSPVLSKLRSVLTESILPFEVQGPSDLGIFVYDNDVFVIETFAKIPQTWSILLPKGKKLEQVGLSNEVKSSATVGDGTTVYDIRLNPSTFQTYRIK
ncbi:permease [Bacillus alkalicellulosilyticus]|uniref:permease n=1 Tax=Alkalihalobacterium alkalicellulosilyticum TaxID=1912214 RepID=UPI0009973340|nr:permease [Bacillus alkalicellulosilyticus]